MTPPEAPVAGIDANADEESPAVSVCLKVMSKRPDFLKAARAGRQATAGFVLQARRRHVAEPDPAMIRIGFTCSKKVGNAVARNRAKRRLREIARLVLPTKGQAGWDYVLIGRAEITATRDFKVLQSDLKEALRRVHGAMK